MPTYEYRCSAGHEFEQFQKMSEAPVDTCPVCGAAAERQLSAGAGLLFKGSGFYITDYRSDSYRKAADADRGASAEGGATKAGDSSKAGGDGPKSGGGAPGGTSGGGKGGASGGGASGGGASGGGNGGATGGAS